MTLSDGTRRRVRVRCVLAVLVVAAVLAPKVAAATRAASSRTHPVAHHGRVLHRQQRARRCTPTTKKHKHPAARCRPHAVAPRRHKPPATAPVIRPRPAAPAAPSPSTQSAPPTAGQPAPGVALFHRTATAFSGAGFSGATVAADAPRRNLLVTQGTYNGGACPYRSVNPEGLCLLYKEALFTESNAWSGVSASSPRYPSGVSYFYANGNHPEWFLTDTSGGRIYNPGYRSYWEMDVGSSAYQHLWAQNAIAEARQYGWNGIFADDLACWAYNTDATSVRYSTRAGWQAAVLSFLTNVGQQLHAAGLKLVSNSSSCVGYPSALHNFAAAEDGVMEEGWMRPNVDPGQPLATAASGVWGNQLSELADAERNHKYYLAELPATSSDTRAIRFALATQLLAAGGYSSFDISGSPNYTAAFWSPDYDAARQLGAPTGAYYQLASGIYRRDFAGGTVLVNPTSATRTVNLGGTYSGSGLTNTTTATLAPETGLILAD